MLKYLKHFTKNFSDVKIKWLVLVTRYNSYGIVFIEAIGGTGIVQTLALS